MEQPREQPPVSPSYATFPAPAYAAPAPRPSFFRVLGSVVRLLVRRLIYGIVWVLRPLRAHALFVVIILALLGVIGYQAVELNAAKGAQPADSRVASIPPAPAVENYLTGWRTFNADMMWEAFSSGYQSKQMQNGASKSTLQNYLRQQQRLGLQYRKVQYIGGVTTEDGGQIYSYSVDVSIRNRAIRLPIVIGTDKDQKIEYIMSPIDGLIQSLN